MVTSKDFTEGMNNLFKEFNKLNPFKKLWYKITSKKSEFQKRMEQPIQKIVDAAVPYFIHKNTEKLKELSKSCKFEKMEVFGKESEIMTYSSPEYEQFYNKECVEAAMKFLKSCEIVSATWKKHKKVIELRLERPGVFIGYHGETISFFENYLGLKIKIKEEKWGINHTINSLSYSMCTNEVEDLL